MSIASSQQGLFSAGCFPLNGWGMREFTRWIKFLHSNFHRTKNRNRNACAQPIRVVEGSGERASSQLPCGLCLMFVWQSIAELRLLLWPKVDRPESLPERNDYGRWEAFSVGTARSRVQCSLSRFLNCVLRSLGDLNCRLFVACSKPRRSLELLARSAATKHKNNSLLRLLLMSATIASLYGGCCVSPCLPTSWKRLSSTRQSIIAVRSRLPIKRSHERKNDGRAHARTAERCENGNGCTSERSCNGTERKLFYWPLLYVQSDLPHVHLVVSATVATFSAIVTVLICSSTGRVGF